MTHNFEIFSDNLHELNIFDYDTMPRKKGEKRNYTEDDIIQAVANIQNKSMTYRKASETFKVPMATLRDRIKQRFSLVPGKTGTLIN